MSDVGVYPMIPINGGTGVRNANITGVDLSNPAVGKVLTSDVNGYCTLQDPAASSVTFTGDTGSPFSTNSVTIFADNVLNQCGATVIFNAQTPTLSLNVSDPNGNTIIGQSSGIVGTTGSFTTALGAFCLNGGQISYSTAVGYGALQSDAAGSNVGIGYLAGNKTSSGDNVFVGTNCGLNGTTLFHNTIIGSQAFASVTGAAGGASNNIVIGYTAGSAWATNESNNICIGSPGVVTDSAVMRLGNPATQTKCFVAAISGVTVAASAPVAVASTGQLSSLGFGTSGQVLTSNGAGVSPTWQAASSSPITFASDTGTPFSTSSVTIFANNTGNACGSSVLFNASTPDITLQVTDGSGNTLIGSGCGTSSIGASNTALGYQALNGAGSGTTQSVAIGYQAALIAANFSSAVAIGFQALNGAGGGGCTVIGFKAGQTAGNSSTALGLEALMTAEGGNNLGLGYQAGFTYGGVHNEANNIVIGNLGVSNDQNVIRIGTQGSGSFQQSTCYIAGIAGASFTAGSPTPQGVIIDTSTGQLIASSSSYTAWVDQTTTPVTMVTNTGYTSDDGATQVVFTLPTTSAIGDWIEINGKGSGLWTIHQAVGQQIQISPTATTLGTGGSLSSVNQYDCVRLRCVTANTIWVVVSQQSSGLTVV